MPIGINLPRLDTLLSPLRPLASNSQNPVAALRPSTASSSGKLFDQVSVFGGRFTSFLSGDGSVKQALQPPDPEQPALVGKIRKQLDIIRTAASNNLEEGVSDETRKRNQTAVDDAILEVARLTDVGVALGGTENALVSPFDTRQIAVVEVVSFDPNSGAKLTGEVLKTAEAAELRIQGGANAVAATTASFRLRGSEGSAVFQVQDDEPLSNLAGRINQTRAQTGVTATIDQNDLVLTSTSRGTDAFVAYEGISVSGQADVDGVNGQQVALFTVDNFTANSPQTVSGRLVSEADSAEVRYLGDAGGQVTATAEFDLIGDRGSASLSITGGEDLAAVADRINALTASTGVTAEVQENELVLRSDNVGSAAQIEVQLTSIDGTTTVSGVNPAQVDSFQIISGEATADHTFTGTVTQSALEAELVLEGGSGGVVTDSATFDLHGDLGSTSVSIEQGESLSDVADRINASTGSTGVIASVRGDDLVLNSSDVGSAATVAVDSIDVEQEVTVTGDNPNQIANFQVVSLDANTTQVLSGTIDQAAAEAELTYEAKSNGQVRQNATFTLTGDLGSVEFTVEKKDRISDIRDLVNASTAETGVVATVNGTELSFQSVDVGSSATVAIDVTSGTFDVQGGNGDGTANGVDAVATINGQTLTGQGDQFNLTDEVGSYTFTAAANFTGSFDSITVASTAGDFNLTGGDGGGTANGLDVQATIDGASLTGVGNQLSISNAAGDFSFQFADGFTGAFDPIEVNFTPGSFDLAGGNGDGTGNGSDAIAEINGQTVTAAGNRFQVTESFGDFSIEFVSGFSGDFDSITLTPITESLDVVGGDGNGSDFGTDALVRINGREIEGRGNQISIHEGGVHLSVDLATGFVGQLDPFEVSSRRSFDPSNSIGPTLDALQVRRNALVLPLTSLGSGGDQSALGDSSRLALRTVDRASEQLEGIESELTSRRDLATQLQLVSGINTSGRAKIVTEQFGALLTANPAIASRLVEHNRRDQLVQLLRA